MTDITNNPEVWVELYADSLYQYAIARVRNADLAEDLVQDTFLAGIRGLGTFQQQSSVLTWLTGILKHKIQDHYRVKWRETPMTDAGADNPDMLRQFDETGHWRPGIPTNWADPARALHEADFQAVLKHCLEGLPIRLATVFVLKEIKELPSTEVCDILGVKDQNFWAMMHRSRLLLRACVEKNWFGRKDTER